MITSFALDGQTTGFTSSPSNVSYVLQGGNITLQWKYSLSSSDDSKFAGVRWEANRGSTASNIILFTIAKDDTAYLGHSLGDFSGHVHNAGSSYSSRLASFKLSNVQPVHTKQKFTCALFIRGGIADKDRSAPVYIKLGSKCYGGQCIRS